MGRCPNPQRCGGKLGAPRSRGREGRASPPAKPRRPGVLLDTGQQLLPLPLSEGRTESLKFCPPQTLAELAAAGPVRVPAHLRGGGSVAGLGSVAVAPRRGLGLCGALSDWSLGGAGGVGARSCPGVHRERECRVLPTNCSSAELSPI